MTLTDFYENTTKKFDVTITFNGSNPDVSSDTVTAYFKTDKTGSTIITSTADVATSGATGVASFDLASSDTNVTPGRYFYEIIWEPASGGRYVLESEKVNILDSITD